MIRIKYISFLLLLFYTLSLQARDSLVHIQQQPGMSIWNDVLHLHGNDTLLITIDLHLHEAKIKGTGKLVLKSDKKQHIYSQQSQIASLTILNSDTVSLEGELSVEKELFVEKGVFDTRNGSLLLVDSCLIKLSNGGSILKGEGEVKLEEEDLYYPFIPMPLAFFGTKIVYKAVFPEANWRNSIFAVLSSKKCFFETERCCSGWPPKPDAPPWTTQCTV